MLLTTIQHPAAVMRGQWELAQPQVAYLRRITKNPGRRPLDITQPPPRTILYPSLTELKELHRQATVLGWIALDLETCGDHIICLGLTAFQLEGTEIGDTLCLRFRLRGGVLAWKPRELTAIVEELYSLLTNSLVGKVFHNGLGFDLKILEINGFKIGGPVVDTMALWHTAYTELPLRLQYLATLFLGMPVWKTLTDADEDEKEDLT